MTFEKCIPGEIQLQINSFVKNEMEVWFEQKVQRVIQLELTLS